MFVLTLKKRNPKPISSNIQKLEKNKINQLSKEENNNDKKKINNKNKKHLKSSKTKIITEELKKSTQLKNQFAYINS